MRGKRARRGVRRYLAGGWCRETLPVNAFLVEHPEGLCLFDAGQTARAAAPGYFPRWHPYFRLTRFELAPDDEAASQLRSLGFDPEQIRWVVLSHLHTDHVGGLAAFAHAEVFVASAEWDRACGVGGRIRGYLPQKWPREVDPRLVDFDGPPVGPFSASFDVAGDRSLLLVPAPGHTPGHMALWGRVNGLGFLCGGDLAASFADLERLAPEIAAFCRDDGLAFFAAHDRPTGGRV